MSSNRDIILKYKQIFSWELFFGKKGVSNHRKKILWIKEIMGFDPKTLKICYL